MVVSQGYAPINAVARHINAPVYIIDVGLQQDVQTVSGILSQKVIHGTHQGYPAMDKEVTGHAIAVGVSVGRSLVKDGVQAVGLGHIGERAMLSALSVTMTILHEELEQASKQNGYQLQLKDVGDFRVDPIGVLAAVGSSEIAALFGLITELARNKVAIVFDDAVTGSAVLSAVNVYPNVRECVFPSLNYEEPIHKMQMKALHMEPCLHYPITGGAGIGAAIGLILLEQAMLLIDKEEVEK